MYSWRPHGDGSPDFYTRLVRIAARKLMVAVTACAALAGCGTSTHLAATATATVTVTATPSPTASSAAGAQPLLQPQSCQRVTTGADGNVGPVLCPGGHPNAYAMPVLESTAPDMMALGEFATSSEVSAAACSDLSKGSTNPIEDGAYRFMRALNGWSFAVDPTDGGLFSNCTGL